MSAKAFLDTNVLIYSIGNDDAKKAAAIELLTAGALISTQNLNEAANVMRKKLKCNYSTIRRVLDKFVEQSILFTPSYATILSALTLAEHTGYGFYDSLIIASAMESGCDILYSEDMQNGQEIEGRLKIANPFA